MRPVARGNPLLPFLPALAVFLVALIVLASIFLGGLIGTGQEFAPLLIFAALVQVSSVLLLVPRLAAAVRRRVPPGSAPMVERALQVTQRLWWLLLVAPTVSLALTMLWPPTPQALFTVPSIIAWALPLLNLLPIFAAYFTLLVVSMIATGQRQA
jgi:hypothetical protein